MYYEILNKDGEVINLIVAEQWFVDKYYPNRYRLKELKEEEEEEEEEVTSEPSDDETPSSDS